VVYARGSLDETYRNGPLGVEQSFTIKRPLTSAATGALTLAISIHSNARLSLAADGGGIEIRPVTGRQQLRYTGPVATDARGRSLPSWLVLDANRLLLRVDARGARYPLNIDPFVEQGPPLTASTALPHTYFGESVALSANGSTALIGSPGGLDGGLAFVFTRSGETWTQQAQLQPTNGEGVFGHGVALSADGNTALVGGNRAWVFTRAGETWTQQGESLVGNDAVGGDNNFFEGAVALSSDGNTALFGHAGDNGNAGAVWVFTRSGEVWTQKGSKLTGGGEMGSAEFGQSLALSGDASTALIGGSDDGRVKGRKVKSGYGAAWVFTRPGETWTQQGPKLTSVTEGNRGHFGKAVALSSNGNTALIAGGNRNHPPVSAFTRSGEAWTQGPALTDPTPKKDPAFGWSVSLSGDGNTALIGDFGDSKNVGAAWVFTRSGEAWSQEGSKLTGSGESGKSLFGWSAALASEGHTALIGEDAFSGGEAWVFTR
jgi:hypothetical protein